MRSIFKQAHFEVMNERALAAITGIFHCSQLIDDVRQNTRLLPAVWAGLTGTADKTRTTAVYIGCGHWWSAALSPRWASSPFTLLTFYLQSFSFSTKEKCK